MMFKFSAEIIINGCEPLLARLPSKFRLRTREIDFVNQISSKFDIVPLNASSDDPATFIFGPRRDTEFALVKQGKAAGGTLYKITMQKTPASQVLSYQNLSPIAYGGVEPVGIDL